VYRRSSYRAWGVIGLVWAVLWRTLGVISLLLATVIGLMVGLGIIRLHEISNIINPFSGRAGGNPL
jgi:hypothetical protein